MTYSSGSGKLSAWGPQGESVFVCVCYMSLGWSLKGLVKDLEYGDTVYAG